MTDQNQTTAYPPWWTWHEKADSTQCQAASQRSDGECVWRYCPAVDGVCPLHREEHKDE